MSRILLLFSISFLIQNALLAQDVVSVIKSAKAQPIKISGGLGTDQVFYHADGIADRRNAPYQYYFNGNVNVVLFNQVNLPFTFTYSNQKFNYTYPKNQQRFNQFGVSPKYKWITAHAGWRNMTFSPYSLNGHTFLGGGIELTPGKFQMAAMYGRLLKPVEYDSTSQNGNKPTYQRMGMGLNMRYEDQGNSYGVSFFRSEDKVSSLHTPLDSIGVTPEQNFVWNTTVRQKLSSKLTLSGDLASSTITKDVRFVDETKQKTLGLITENTTSVTYYAYNTKISYQLRKAKIGGGYERIAPGYRTHGAYYFNNDLENITMNYATPLFKNKVNAAFNIGTQRNNLDKSKISTMRRWVGSLNLNWQPSQKLNFGFNYSNFQTYTNMRSQFALINSTNPYQFIDTLNYVQISQSINLNANYIISSSDKKQQNLMINSSAQKASEQQGGKELPSGSTFYNVNIAYMYAIVPLKLAFNLAANGNWNQNINADSKIFGPTAGISKALFKKKMNTNLSYSWNTTLNNNVSTGYVGSLRLTATYLMKKHSFTLSFVWLNRESKTATTVQPTFNEFTGRVGYNFRF